MAANHARATGTGRSGKNSRVPLIVAIMAVIVLIELFAIFRFSACSSEPVENEAGFSEDPVDIVYRAPLDGITYRISADEVWDIPEEDGVFGFSLLQAGFEEYISEDSEVQADDETAGRSHDHSEDPTVETEEDGEDSSAASVIPTVPSALKNAVADAEDSYADDDHTFGFLLMDLETGRGFAYNIDEEFYGASSFKAPFAAFICEKYLETEEESPDDQMYTSGRGIDYIPASLRVEDLINQTITYSDNSAYGVLRQNFGYTETFERWLGSLGMEPSQYAGETWYPTYSVREAAVFWADIWNYIESDGEYSEWLAGLFADTNLSALRDASDWAAEDLAADLNVDVLNKAGWIYDVDYEAIIDNGIIYVDGSPYLMCLSTNAPYNDANFEELTELAYSILMNAEVLQTEPSDEDNAEESD